MHELSVELCYFLIDFVINNEEITVILTITLS